MMFGMQLTHVLRADLNLIPALAVLLDERHVSRAAQRLGLSQPATSRALQRLRLQLGDPLLVRAPDGYRLTARAQVLRGQLDELLPGLETLVAPDPFEPAHTAEPVQLAGTDFAVLAYGPAIHRYLAREAPTAPIRFHSWRYDSMADQIRRGSVDLGLFGSFTTDDLSGADLIEEQFVCVVDTDSRAPTDGLDLDRYCRMRHVVVDVADAMQPDIDLRLRAMDLERTAAVTLPYHAAVPLMLAGTDLVATIPAALAATWPQQHPVRILAAPKEIEHLRYRMVWHPAYDEDHRHQWLRSTIRAAVTETASRQ